MLHQEVDLGTPVGTDSVEIGPLTLARFSRREAIELVRSSILLRKPLDIGICNAHTILTAIDNPGYAQVLNRMTLLNDGIGANLASRYLHGVSFPANLNGTDLIPDILDRIGISTRIYLLGAKEEQVLGAKAHIEATYPQHEVVGCRNGYFDLDDCDDVCRGISKCRPDLLLVAMGNPRQEIFIDQCRAKLKVTVTIGVGALFDFMSGTVVRAPGAVQSVGMEWLFRLLQEPRRLANRYLIGIPRFFSALRRIKSSQLGAGAAMCGSASGQKPALHSRLPRSVLSEQQGGQS